MPDFQLLALEYFFFFFSFSYSPWISLFTGSMLDRVVMAESDRCEEMVIRGKKRRGWNFIKVWKEGPKLINPS
ncbi:hypothetical protein I7I53_08202 [Histoplasma capsulatum var. duboisii H88]|uniref:Uncharacterized protein n=1 Tax=Ajellomyces capsulatus (strain H88) TaxID=544711 RepID=A0A8A1LF82_AJEC8|nr:hypothetical protein I7I53_08202 [Histoplasma capsulatum var. duboisii H88]